MKVLIKINLFNATNVWEAPRWLQLYPLFYLNLWRHGTQSTLYLVFWTCSTSSCYISVYRYIASAAMILMLIIFVFFRSLYNPILYLIKKKRPWYIYTYLYTLLYDTPVIYFTFFSRPPIFLDHRLSSISE